MLSMPKQPAFPGFRQAMKKQTRCETFVAEMEAALRTCIMLRWSEGVSAAVTKPVPRIRRECYPLVWFWSRWNPRRDTSGGRCGKSSALCGLVTRQKLGGGRSLDAPKLLTTTGS